MPLRLGFVLLATAVVAAGCGGEDEPRAQRPPAPVKLSVTSPGDTSTVRDASVEVRGTVAPAGAAVTVMGRQATVDGGSFSAEVALEPGANVIDVMATARNRGAAMTAVRVGRELPVAVPDFGGMSVEEAQEEAADAGLELEVVPSGGLLEDLLPGEPGVCDQDPEAGTEVRRGSTARVAVRKSC